MRRLGATTFRQAVDRLTGLLRPRWCEALLATSVAIAAAATAGFAALQLSSHLTQTADALAQSRMSGFEGLPDVSRSRCLDRSEGRP